MDRRFIDSLFTTQSFAWFCRSFWKPFMDCCTQSKKIRTFAQMEIRLVFPIMLSSGATFFLHRTSLGDLMGPPEFDIGLSTTYLIYGQALTWLGMYFVPLLPLISCVILAITFYIRRVTLAVNMSVSTNPWKANRTESFLHFFTFLSAIFTLLVFFLVISE